MPTLRESVIPEDFNRDGRVDLIAGERRLGGRFDGGTGPVWVRLGNGDGTFGLPLSSNVVGTPVTTGDFNGDGRPDVVVVADDGAMSILPGRGNGKFDAPRALDRVEDFRFALSADMNGDGDLDLVLGYGATVDVQTGFGDFTFRQHVLPPGNDDGPSIAVAADFNGDERLDLAVAQKTTAVFIYLNRGGGLFAPSEILTVPESEGEPDEIRGLTATDLDEDGDEDLVIPHTFRVDFGWSQGGVGVALNKGDGTFASLVSYATGLVGPMTAAAGDFNADGHMDVAIGCRAFNWDDLENFLNGWDSIAIFSGRGDGTLAGPARFRLDTTPPGSSTPRTYVDTHTALRAANINGDARTDLVASPGAVVLLRPPAANRPPTVSAGPDLLLSLQTTVIIHAAIVERDWEHLTVRWQDSEGRPRSFGSSVYPAGSDTYTVTVTDDRGAVATDSVRFETAAPQPDPPIRILSPRAGQRFVSGSTISIRFEVHVPQGDSPNQRVEVSSDNFRTWKVIDEGEFDNFQWRNAGPPGTWRARIIVLGTHEFITAITDPFVIEGATGTALSWPWLNADVGFVGIPGRATHASGTFSVRGAGRDIWGTADAFHFAYQELVGDGSLTARVAGISGSQRWTKVGVMIRESLDEGAAHHFLLASLARGNAYQRRLAYRGSSLSTTLPAASAPVFRITRQGGMVRLQMATAAGATFRTVATASFPEGRVFIGLVTSSHETERLATGTFDRVQVQGGGAVPPRVEITSPMPNTIAHSGEPLRVLWTASPVNSTTQFNVFFRDPDSGEGSNFCPDLLPASARSCTGPVPNIVGRTGSIVIQATDQAGNHSEVVRTFTIEDAREGPVPLGWAYFDLGHVGAAGSITEMNGRWTIRGAGAAVWGTSDAFFYVFKGGVGGDYDFSARVVSVDNVNEWTKAGLMLRGGTNHAQSLHAFVVATPTTRRGVVFHRRPADGDITLHTAGPRVAPPVWLKLERRGDVVSAFSRRAPADAWTLIGRHTYPSTGFYVGFAVASYRAGTLATAVFDNVTITQR